jgi:hypothetical protein
MLLLVYLLRSIPIGYVLNGNHNVFTSLCRFSCVAPASTLEECPGSFVTVTAAHEDDGSPAFCFLVVVFMVVGLTGD